MSVKLLHALLQRPLVLQQVVTRLVMRMDSRVLFSGKKRKADEGEEDEEERERRKRQRQNELAFSLLQDLVVPDEIFKLIVNELVEHADSDEEFYLVLVSLGLANHYLHEFTMPASVLQRFAGHVDLPSAYARGLFSMHRQLAQPFNDRVELTSMKEFYEARLASIAPDTLRAYQYAERHGLFSQEGFAVMDEVAGPLWDHRRPTDCYTAGLFRRAARRSSASKSALENAFNQARATNSFRIFDTGLLYEAVALELSAERLVDAWTVLEGPLSLDIVEAWRLLAAAMRATIRDDGDRARVVSDLFPLCSRALDITNARAAPKGNHPHRIKYADAFWLALVAPSAVTIDPTTLVTLCYHVARLDTKRLASHLTACLTTCLTRSFIASLRTADDWSAFLNVLMRSLPSSITWLELEAICVPLCRTENWVALEEFAKILRAPAFTTGQLGAYHTPEHLIFRHCACTVSSIDVPLVKTWQSHFLSTPLDRNRFATTLRLLLFGDAIFSIRGRVAELCTLLEAVKSSPIRDWGPYTRMSQAAAPISKEVLSKLDEILPATSQMEKLVRDKVRSALRRRVILGVLQLATTWADVVTELELNMTPDSNGLLDPQTVAALYLICVHLGFHGLSEARSWVFIEAAMPSFLSTIRHLDTRTPIQEAWLRRYAAIDSRLVPMRDLLSLALPSYQHVVKTLVTMWMHVDPDHLWSHLISPLGLSLYAELDADHRFTEAEWKLLAEKLVHQPRVLNFIELIRTQFPGYDAASHLIDQISKLLIESYAQTRLRDGQVVQVQTLSDVLELRETPFVEKDIPWRRDRRVVSLLELCFWRLEREK